MTEIDTFNKYFVAVHVASDDICFLRPVPLRISRTDALLLAAYLASMADPIGDDFKEVLKAVQSA